MKQKGKFDQSQMRHQRGGQGDQSLSKAEVENKKARFREFLKLMGTKSTKTNANQQSWNDQFESFMGDTVPLEEEENQKKRKDKDGKDRSEKDKTEEGDKSKGDGEQEKPD